MTTTEIPKWLKNSKVYDNSGANREDLYICEFLLNDSEDFKKVFNAIIMWEVYRPFPYEFWEHFFRNACWLENHFKFMKKYWYKPTANERYLYNFLKGTICEKIILALNMEEIECAKYLLKDKYSKHQSPNVFWTKFFETAISKNFLEIIIFVEENEISKKSQINWQYLSEFACRYDNVQIFEYFYNKEWPMKENIINFSIQYRAKNCFNFLLKRDKDYNLATYLIYTSLITADMCILYNEEFKIE